VRVNGERVPEVTPPKDGPQRVGVNVTVPLSVGENVIGIVATNRSGRSAQAIRTVTRSAPPVVAPRPQAPERPKQEWFALVIGVGEYDDKSIAPLKFAENDARGVYAFLTTKGGYKKENVILIADSGQMTPTLANMKRGFADLLRRSRKDDTVFVYYAGYGAPEVDAAGKEIDGQAKYLVPRDAEPTSLFATAFSLENLETIFLKFSAERVVFALDASFSGQPGGRTFTRQSTRAGVATNEFLDRVSKSRGRVMMFASAPNQIALDFPEMKHGLFTYFLLQGLSGAADTDGDGVVTVNELFAWVQPKVTERARQQNIRQNPSMSGQAGDLPFVMVQK
jgi:uncharacterized caspase-like protein